MEVMRGGTKLWRIRYRIGGRGAKLAITDKIKNRGADQMALQTRNVLKRLFAYAIAREKTQFNPAAAIEAKFIASARGRDVALSPEEVGKLLRAIYHSSIRRAYKLALHLLILDELSQIDPKEAGEAACLLANGQGAGIPNERRSARRGAARGERAARSAVFFTT